MGWKESELLAFNWFKDNYDNEAILKGEENSNYSDIFSPKFNSYIEVKDLTDGARAGQFTESTIKNNPFSEKIYRDEYTNNDIIEFIKYHYQKKNVSHFIVIYNNEIQMYNWDNFFNAFVFELQKPYKKRSGTRSAPKKDFNDLLLNPDFYQENDKIYCRNTSYKGQYYSLKNPFDYFISKTNGELRKRSNTNNLTWHMIIKLQV